MKHYLEDILRTNDCTHMWGEVQSSNNNYLFAGFQLICICNTVWFYLMYNVVFDLIEREEIV